MILFKLKIGHCNLNKCLALIKTLGNCLCAVGKFSKSWELYLLLEMLYGKRVRKIRLSLKDRVSQFSFENVSSYKKSRGQERLDPF